MFSNETNISELGRIALEGYKYSIKKRAYHDEKATVFKAVLDVVGIDPNAPIKRRSPKGKRKIGTFAAIVYDCLNNNGPQTAKQIGEYFKNECHREISRAGCASQLSALSRNEELISWINYRAHGVEGNCWWVYKSWLDEKGQLKTEYAQKIQKRP